MSKKVHKPSKETVAAVIYDLKQYDASFNNPLVSSLSRANVACQFFMLQDGKESFMKQIITLLEALNTPGE
jgi:hypothetical protein